MAKSLDYYIKQATKYVSPAYDIQEKALRQQIGEAQKDPYYEQLLKSLEAKKDIKLGSIEARAAQRGVAYGSIPSQGQQRYLATDYLPAVAEIKRTQQEYIRDLQLKLADLRAQRAQAAQEFGYKLRESDISVEEAARDRAVQLAKASVAKASASGSSLSKWEVEQQQRQMIQEMFQEGYSWGDIADTLDANWGAGTATTHDKTFWNLFMPHIDYDKAKKDKVYSGSIDWSQTYKDALGRYRSPFKNVSTSTKATTKRGKSQQRKTAKYLSSMFMS